MFWASVSYLESTRWAGCSTKLTTKLATRVLDKSHIAVRAEFMQREAARLTDCTSTSEIAELTTLRNPPHRARHMHGSRMLPNTEPHDRLYVIIIVGDSPSVVQVGSNYDDTGRHRNGHQRISLSVQNPPACGLQQFTLSL